MTKKCGCKFHADTMENLEQLQRRIALDVSKKTKDKFLKEMCWKNKTLSPLNRK